MTLTQSNNSPTLLPAVGRIYVEREALHRPNTERILEKMRGTPVQEIGHYKDIFNRPGQHFQVQKGSPALILAVERDRLLYDGSARVASWDGDVPLYYNAPVRNCLYNCDYCFLQGMHSSANIVVFVNTEDFMHAARERAALGSYFLSISYLTDLLALEPLIPLCSEWIRFAEQTSGITVEIRTKSDLFRLVSHIDAPNNTVLSFSLSPDAIARTYERGCAPLHGRLLAARQAIKAGWRVRLCIDPIIRTPDWSTQYSTLVEQIFSRLDAESIEEVSFGVVRMAPDFLSRVRHMRHDSPMLFYPFVKEQDPGLPSVVTYPTDARTEMRSYVHSLLSRHIPENRIHFVHG